ncbi:MAG: hypothetical protein ACREU4_13290, partial [Burkholderiales bacterium]
AIRTSRGEISQASLLTNLACEFGYAGSSPGKMAALRDALDVDGIAAFDGDAPASGKGAPRLYHQGMEAHDLGSVLVSAVFEAFVTIYQRKTARILRIAGVSAGDLGRGHLDGDLARVLAEQASRLAGEFLNVCVRAIDYCPPVDMEICEYLRALVTADAAVVPEDKWGYREALMRSFRRRHLFPDHVGFMSEEAVMWRKPERPLKIPSLAFSELKFEGDPAHAADRTELRRQADELGVFVSSPKNAPAFALVAPGAPLPEGIEYVSPIRIESIRCARRVTPDGGVLFDLVAEVLQSGTVRRKGTLFDFTGGSTIVLDPAGGVRYAIYKRLASADRQDRQLKAMRGP